jgi:ubiquinone biosynthesis protein
MQDPALIPTPLVTERRRIKIVAVRARDPFRLFRVLRFLFSVSLFWWRTTFSLVISGGANTRARARRVREFLERMGGMWVKAGQLAALRRDVFLPETCDELSKLQDEAFGFAYQHVEATIERELGAPISELFSEFDPEPLAAASIGQTHVATLRETGARVVVKVQRPYMAEFFRSDMRYLRFVGWCMNRLGIGQQLRWDELLVELETVIADELDYRGEASAAIRMRKILRRHGAYGPRVFQRYCSKRVLVLEYLVGPFMSDFIAMSRKDPARVQAWLVENNIDPKRLAKRLALSHMRQTLEEDLYHADLHPGNILLQRDSRFALIDFGAVDMLERSMRERFRIMYRAIAERDFGKTADMFLLLAPRLPYADLSSLKLTLVRLLRAWAARAYIANIPYHEKSSAAFFSAALKQYQQYGISAEWGFLRLTRSDHTLDASLAFLHPRMNQFKVAQRYDKQARRRAQRHALRMQEVLEGTMAVGNSVRQWAENMHFNGEWLRKRALDFQGRISKMAALASTVLSLVRWCLFGLVALFVIACVRNRGVISPFDLRWLHETTDDIIHGTEPLEATIAAGILVIFVASKLSALRGRVLAKDFDRATRS